MKTSIGPFLLVALIFTILLVIVSVIYVNRSNNEVEKFSPNNKLWDSDGVSYIDEEGFHWVCSDKYWDSVTTEDAINKLADYTYNLQQEIQKLKKDLRSLADTTGYEWTEGKTEYTPPHWELKKAPTVEPSPKSFRELFEHEMYGHLQEGDIEDYPIEYKPK